MINFFEERQKSKDILMYEIFSLEIILLSLMLILVCENTKYQTIVSSPLIVAYKLLQILLY